MTDFVLESSKQPLTLGMFIPVDKHGVILEDLKFCCSGSDCGCMGQPVNVGSQEEIDEYYEAKENVIFKDAVVYDYSPFIQTKRILINLKCDQTFRVYTELQYASGGIERKTFPNWYFSRPPLIEDVLGYDLELSASAIKQIGL